MYPSDGFPQDEICLRSCRDPHGQISLLSWNNINVFQAYFFKLGVFLLGEGVDLRFFLTYVITVFFLYFATYMCTHSHAEFQLECYSSRRVW